MNPSNQTNRNNRVIFYCAIESIHNTIFHLIETVKVRSQARNLVSGDISHYFQNQVEKKPLISGVISGFFGALSGAFVFSMSFSHLTNVFYSNVYKDVGPFNRIKQWDFRYKNVLIYAVSDITASFVKAPFEVRKQLIQMYSKDIQLQHLTRLVAVSWLPLAMRDTTFRTIILSF